MKKWPNGPSLLRRNKDCWHPTPTYTPVHHCPMASCLKMKRLPILNRRLWLGLRENFYWVESPSFHGLKPWGKVVFCRDCRKAGLRDEFALGKIRPPKGRKKEYLRRHALSDNNPKHAIATAKTDSSVLNSVYFWKRSLRAINWYSLHG